MHSAKTSCCRSRTTKWSMASGRCCPRCRATTGNGSPTCACSWATCGCIRARSCCSWVANSGNGANGTTTRAWTGICSPSGRISACNIGYAISSAVSRRARAARRRLPRGGLRVDRQRRCGEQRALVPSARWRRWDNRRRVQFHADAAPQLSRWRSWRRLLARGSQQRRDLLRREWAGQPGWHRCRADGSGRALSLDQCYAAAAGRRGLQGDRMARVQAQYSAPRASLEVDNGLRPVVIENVKPRVDHGRFAIKRTPGETVVVEADIFADGHDQLRCLLRHRRAGARDWFETSMTALGNDRWRAGFIVTELGRYEYQVTAWVDAFLSWRHDFVRRSTADEADIALALQTVAALVQDAAN